MTYGIDSGARCAVVGYGSWATALVKILLENEAEVGWYVRSRDVLEHIRRHGTNPRYLSGVHFPSERLFLSDDLDAVVRGADIIVLAVPSVYLKTTLDALSEPLDGKFVVSAIKGIVPDELVTVAEYVNRRYGVPFDRIGIVSGPCHAEEVALERLSYLTAVCKNMDDSVMLGRKIRTPYIAVSHSTDIYGIEYASVLKNIYALAVGLAVGLGYGDNFLAVLISNSAMEMSRFLNESGPDSDGRNTLVSAYLGDLLVTCYSVFSRNRRLGLLIGRGSSVKGALAEMTMVAEGYYAADCIRHVNRKHKVEMPIADMVYEVLYRGASARKAMKALTTKLI